MHRLTIPRAGYRKSAKNSTRLRSDITAILIRGNDAISENQQRRRILRNVNARRRTDANARISVYIAASYDAARNVHMPGKRKQKKGRRIRTCEMEES